MIEIKLSGQNRVDKALVTLQRKIVKPSAALNKIGMTMLSSINQNFEMEGRPEKWESLSPMTLAMRRNKKKKSSKILQDTGLLKGSITYDATREGGTAVAIGTNKKYGKVHQFGGKIRIPARTIIPKNAKALRFVIGDKVVFATKVNQKARTVTIPQRQFLKFQDNDIEDIRNILLESIVAEE